MTRSLYFKSSEAKDQHLRHYLLKSLISSPATHFWINTRKIFPWFRIYFDTILITQISVMFKRADGVVNRLETHTLPILICISLGWMYSADKHDTTDTYSSWVIHRIHRCLMIWVRFPAGLCITIASGQKKTLYPINNEDVSCLVYCLRPCRSNPRGKILHLSNNFSYVFRGGQKCCLNDT